MDKIETKPSKPLIIVLIVMIMLFLIFSGGALYVTLEDGGMMGTGWGSGISWMWIPALLFLTLSIMLVWVMKTKKKDSN
jgi:uncharacterized membrane protein